MNRFLKISGAIFISIIVILIVIKIFFSAPSFDKDVRKFVKGMNKQCPEMVDPETRLDKVLVFEGDNLQFNYTLIHMLRDSIPIQGLKSYMQPVILEKIKNSGTLRKFLDKNMTWIYSYNDMKGEFIFKVTYTPEQIAGLKKY